MPNTFFVDAGLILVYETILSGTLSAIDSLHLVRVHFKPLIAKPAVSHKAVAQTLKEGVSHFPFILRPLQARRRPMYALFVRLPRNYNQRRSLINCDTDCDVHNCNFVINPYSVILISTLV